MEFDASAVAIFTLALARTSAWAATSPLFSSNGIAGVGRLAFAISLALMAAPVAPDAPPPPTELAIFIPVLVGQIALGLLLGWITGLALAVFQSAGAIVDLTSGFSVAQLLDPATGAQSAVIGRLFSVAFIALFFATNAHLVVVGGLVRSFQATPVTEIPFLGADSVAMAAASMSDLMLAALEIAAPMLGALLLAEVALALAARFVPQANIFMIGLPLKMGIAIAVVGSTLIFLPAYTERIVERTAYLMAGVAS
jgi:flagellar biosynthetic protein FliR